MLVVNQYLYLPGCCTFCRSSNLPTIDTEIDLDHPNDPNDPNPSAIRRLYICADCAIEFARLVKDDRGIEFQKAGFAATVEGMIEGLTNSNVDLSKRVNELESALRVVKSISQPEATEPAPAAGRNFKVVVNPDDTVVDV